MKNWVETDLSVENAFSIDPREYLRNHPEFIQVDTGGATVWQCDHRLVLTNEFTALLNNYFSCDITGILAFYRKAGYQHPSAHIDVDPQGGALLPVSTSYNWVLEEDNNPMVWYKPWWDPENIDEARLAAKGQLPFPGLGSSSPDAGTMTYQETPCDLLDRDSEHCLSHKVVTVCRTNIPHNVDMISDKDRWCITARSWGDQDPMWSQVYNKLVNTSP